MKIRNLKDYKDKETKEKQITGDIREVSDKRGKVIIKAGYAEEIIEEAEAAAKAKN